MSAQPLLDHLHKLHSHSFDASLDLQFHQHKATLQTQFTHTLHAPSQQLHLFNRLLNQFQDDNRAKGIIKSRLTHQLANDRVVSNTRQQQVCKQKTHYGQLMQAHLLANNVPVNLESIHHALLLYPRVMAQMDALYQQQVLLQKEHQHEIRAITKQKQEMQRAINGQEGIVTMTQEQTLRIKDNYPVYTNRNTVLRQRIGSIQRKQAASQERRASQQQKIQSQVNSSIEQQVKQKIKVHKAEKVLHFQQQVIGHKQEEAETLHQKQEPRKRIVRQIFFMEWMLELFSQHDPVQYLGTRIHQRWFQEEFIKKSRVKHLNRFYLQAKIQKFFEQNGSADEVATSIIGFIEQIQILYNTQFNRKGDLQQQKRKLNSILLKLEEETKQVVAIEQESGSEQEDGHDDITVNRLQFSEQGGVVKQKEIFVQSQQVILGLMTSLQGLLNRFYSILCDIRLALGTKLGEEVLGEGYQDLLAAMRVVLLNQVNGPTWCFKQAQIQKQDHSFLFYEESNDTSQSNSHRATPRSIPSFHRKLVRPQHPPLPKEQLGHNRIYAEQFQSDLMLQLLVGAKQKEEAIQNLVQYPAHKEQLVHELQCLAQLQLQNQLYSLFQSETNLMLNLFDLTKHKYTHLITNNPSFSLEEFLATDCFRSHMPYLSTKQDYQRVLHKLTIQTPQANSPKSPCHKEQQEIFVGQAKSKIQARQHNLLQKQRKSSSPPRPQSSYLQEEKRLQKKYLGRVLGLVSKEHKARKDLSVRSPQESLLLTRPSTFRAAKRPLSLLQSTRKSSPMASLDVSQIQRSLLRELERGTMKHGRSKSAQQDLSGLRNKVRANRGQLGL